MLLKIKASLSRVWAFIVRIDQLAPRSAAAGLVLSIMGSLILAFLFGLFDSDPEPNVTLEEYKTKLAVIACLNIQHQELGARTNYLRDTLLVGGATPQEQVQILRAWENYSLRARKMFTEMQSEMQGVIPPNDFSGDHKKMMGSIRLTLNTLSKLDAALPPDMTRPDAEILKDPDLAARLKNSESVTDAGIEAVDKIKVSDEFLEIYDCPGQSAPEPPPVRTVVVPTPTPSRTPTPQRPAVTPTPSFVLPSPTPFVIVFPTATPLFPNPFTPGR